jgi:Ca-activated chloride channel family protein
MGSPAGVPIPVRTRSTNRGFLKDQNGNTVLSKLNEQLLAQISEAGGGVYVRASNNDDGLRTILEEINNMSKREFESQVYTEYEDRYQFLVLPAFILLMLELLISDRKSVWWHKLDLFGDSENNKKANV